MRWTKYSLLSFFLAFLTFIVIYQCQTRHLLTPVKEKIFFARRIIHIGKESHLSVDPNMPASELRQTFYNKEIIYPDYIHNGPWVFRPVLEEGKYADAPLKNLNPMDVWEITKEQINKCDVLVAVVSPTAYGTLAEVAYAVGRGDIAVYVFPDNNMTEEEITDLWYLFQMALSTKHLWKEKHFKYKPNIFPKENLNPQKYEESIRNITPMFARP
ncbi:MAG: nucleoside 2-deoxyribosyltransferase [Alphaproteobacteria bacterium]|nr:nucleoside 2-deoxyribosyltransferase [Alphaproteobacteria bacterium]MBY0502026.1 nucleoside 2-deoxyribosyltransferase [Alphaproteobacteria bacterium]